MTDGQIVIRGRNAGSAFLLDPLSVLTAAHVIGEARPSGLAFRPDGGKPVTVAEIRTAPEIDAAVLTLTRAIPDHQPSAVHRCIPGRLPPTARWQVEARPDPDSPLLTGSLHGIRSVKNIFGYEMRTLQLEVSPRLGAFNGYSGAAVRVDGAVVGMLFQQIEERINDHDSLVPRASDALYAVPLVDILDRFGLGVSCAPWWEDLRWLFEALADNGDLPDTLRRPEHTAVQAYEVLAAAFTDDETSDTDWLAERIGRLWHQSADRDPVYRLATPSPLTVDTLRSMLDQLAKVHATALTLPRHVRQPRYRIEAPGTTLDDVAAEVDRWLHERTTAPSDDEGADRRRDDESRNGEAHDDEAPRDLVRRLDPLVQEVDDPVGELIARLGRAGSDRPADAARGLVRRLFQGPEAAELPTQLERHLRPGKAAARALTAADRPPDRVRSLKQGYLVNEQPTLEHLREGFFAETDALDTFERAYWSWYERTVLDPVRLRDLRVPMFWITGPSGAGKSILLLQLLARLNARTGVSALLPRRGARLSDAAGWAAGIAGPRHVVIGVDDPLSWTEGDHTPWAERYRYSAWPQVFRTLADQRRTTSGTETPIFVCCAPSEQRAEFARTYDEEAFVGEVRLDPYRREYVSALRSWFTDRTGEEPPAIPEQGSGFPRPRTPPALLFLEWHSREGIKPYTERFRERIERQGQPELSRFFPGLLAVNRLDVGYPREAVDLVALDKALRPYQDDEHIHLSDRGGRPGYWIGHPEIARQMYEHWGASDAERSAHLRDALLAAHQAVSRGWAAVPLLRAIQTAARGGGAADEETGRSGRDRRELVRDVRAALVEVVERLGAQPPELADPVLAEWVRVEHRCRLSGPTRWRPREHALTRLRDRPTRGTDELIRALVELDNSGVDRKVWEYARRHPEWPDWLTLALPLVRRRRLDTDPLVARMVESAAVRPPAAITLLTEALSSGFTDGPVVQLAHRLVRGELPADASPAPLVKALYLRDRRRPRSSNPLAAFPIHERVVTLWLRAGPRVDDGTVWVEILRHPVPPALRPALEAWVGEFPAERTAGSAIAHWLDWQWVKDDGHRKLLQAHLGQCRDIDPLLEERLRGLLSADGPAWSWLFTVLPAQWVRDLRVRAAAQSWLEARRNVAAWPRVYQHLCAAAGAPDSRLRDIGAGFLASAGEKDSGTAYVRYWMIRVSTEQEQSATVREAYAWLRQRPELAHAWGLLAGSILRATPPGDVGPVIGVLLDWVRAHPGEGAAAQVLTACLDTGTSTELRRQVLACLVEWLAVPRPGWARAFMAAQSVLTNEQRTALALPWLLERVDKRYWLRVFYVTADQFNPTQLAAVMRRWFATAAARDFAAGPLWRAAIENDGPCADLLDDSSFRRDVVDWLRRGGGVASWRPIALSLILRDPDAEVLRAVVQSDAPLDRRYGLADDLEERLRTRPEPAEQMCRIMEQLDRTDTWHMLWRRLVSVAPGERTWTVSQRLLVDDRAAGHAPTLWVRLWDAYPDPRRREWLAHLAEQRLTACPTDEPAWQEARKRLITSAEPDCGEREAYPQLILTPVVERPAEPVECLAECSHCQHPLEITTLKKIFQYVCPKCDFDLTIDTDLAEVITARSMTRVTGHLVDVGNKGARMLCDRCGNERTETMRLDGHHIAVDRQCGLLHAVPATEVTDFREHRRHRAMGLSDDNG